MVNQLLHILKHFQNEPLDGFLIAKIEVKSGDCVNNGIQFKKLYENKIAAIIQEQLLENEWVKLILIKSGISENEGKSSNNLGEKISEVQFSKIELEEFLEKSGDKNSVHFGENPIVPGLLILEKILDLINEKLNLFEFKFFTPMHLNSKLSIYKVSDNEYVGSTENKIIFKFHKN